MSLHDKIVEASRREFDPPPQDGAELNTSKVEDRPLRIPDLYQKDTAVKCLVFPNNNGKLELLGRGYKELIIAIALPDNVTQVWIYRPSVDSISDKFTRKSIVWNPEKEDNNLHCNRCGYDWSPRVDRPKRCPECQSRYWDVEIWR